MFSWHTSCDISRYGGMLHILEHILVIDKRQTLGSWVKVPLARRFLRERYLCALDVHSQSGSISQVALMPNVSTFASVSDAELTDKAEVFHELGVRTGWPFFPKRQNYHFLLLSHYFLSIYIYIDVWPLWLMFSKCVPLCSIVLLRDNWLKSHIGTDRSGYQGEVSSYTTESL